MLDIKKGTSALESKMCAGDKFSDCTRGADLHQSTNSLELKEIRGSRVMAPLSVLEQRKRSD